MGIFSSLESAPFTGSFYSCQGWLPLALAKCRIDIDVSHADMRDQIEAFMAGCEQICPLERLNQVKAKKFGVVEDSR